MTRRHEALVPLSHDHHHALHNARLLKEASEGDVGQRTLASKAFVAFFRADSVPHFREEEEEIFPLVARSPNAPIEKMTHVLVEHVQIHALVRELDNQASSGDASAETMKELAALLRAHIRFEEDVLFPEIEQLAGGVLESVNLAERKRL